MHAVRLGYQGIELLETGRVTLPMPEPERSRVMAVRLGERSFDEVIAEIDEVEGRLAAALERTAAAGGARPRRRRRVPRRRLPPRLGLAVTKRAPPPRAGGGAAIMSERPVSDAGTKACRRGRKPLQIEELAVWPEMAVSDPVTRVSRSGPDKERAMSKHLPP